MRAGYNHIRWIGERDAYHCMRSMSLLLLIFHFSGLAYGQYSAQKCYVESSELRYGMTERRDLHEGEVLIIPVAVHIVYQNEDQNISDSQILSQLKSLNLDFRRKNQNVTNTVSEFLSLATDVGIEFELADTLNAVGESVKGITRTSTSHIAFANNDLHDADLGGADAWNEEKYFNIWVANLAEGIIGYASRPGNKETFDGVAIHFENFGTEGTAQEPYHLGRTLTHETGHWLGLNHLWGDGDCSSDDGITDTPNQKQNSSGCELTKSSCGSLDMVQNFMDFSNDECMSLFTAGQALQMRNSLITLRSGTYKVKVVSGIEIARPEHGRITCIYTDGMIRINVSSIRANGELSIYSLSGKSLYQQHVLGSEQKITVEIGDDLYGVGIVRYQTSNGAFSAKFMNKG